MVMKNDPLSFFYNFCKKSRDSFDGMEHYLVEL